MNALEEELALEALSRQGPELEGMQYITLRYFYIVFLNDFYNPCKFISDNICLRLFIFTEPITNEVEPVNDAHKVNKRRKFRRKKYYSYTTNNKRCFACKFALGQNIIIFIFDKKFMVVRDKLFGH